MKNNLFILFVGLLSLFGKAQERRLSVDVMTPLYTTNYAIHYEQVYQIADKQFLGFRAGIGAGRLFFANQFTVQGVYYLGKRHQLELSPGLIYETNFRPWGEKGSAEMLYMAPLNHRKSALFMRIGYVYNTKGDWSFRAGINTSVIFNHTNKSNSFLPFAPYLGVSYRF